MSKREKDDVSMMIKIAKVQENGVDKKVNFVFLKNYLLKRYPFIIKF